MLKRITQKLSEWLGGGTSRLKLQRRGDEIVLAAFRGETAVRLSELIKRHKALAALGDLLSPHHEVQAVPLSVLTAVRHTLDHARVADDPLEITIATAVAALKQIEPPADFAVAYVWSPLKLQLERQIKPANTLYFGDGWFVQKNRYWQLADLDGRDDKWLWQQAIEGQAVVDFLTQIKPNWHKRQLPFQIPLSYDKSPVLTLKIENVAEASVRLHMTWHESPRSLRMGSPTAGYVVAGECVRPGIHPQSLAVKQLKKGGAIDLAGEEIAQFRQRDWPLLKPWATGDVQRFQARHRILQDDGALKLVIQHEMPEGVGVTTAVPTFSNRHLSLPAHEAKRLLATGQHFYRVADGWVPLDIFRQAGLIPAQTTPPTHHLAPFVLTPGEILQRGSARLENSWPLLDFPPLQLPRSGTDEQIAQQHLTFLRTWGLPGGLIGKLSRYQTAWAQLFAELTAVYPPSKILVVGSKTTLDMVEKEWEGLVNGRFNGIKSDPAFSPYLRGVVLATPKAFSTQPELLKTEWQLLCLLHADDLIKSNRSQLYGQLSRCRQRWTLGLFASDDFLDKTPARDGLAHIFGLQREPDDRLVWRYTLRNPQQSAPALPAAFKTIERGTVQRGAAAFTINQPGKTQALSLPPRQTAVSPPLVKKPAVTFRSRESSFVQQAKKLANQREKRASFVPFQQYWPQYSDLSQQQGQWYFYWRDQVRQQHYPDTDLSYIFLHAYELVNQIGSQSNADGYTQLRRLWQNYRQQHPQLDNYLPDWLADSAIVYENGRKPLPIYAEAVAAGADAPHLVNLALAHYVSRPFSEWPLSLLERLTDYQIQRSKFYLADNEKLVAQTLAQVLERLNGTMEQPIWTQFRPPQQETIRRRPFAGALYAGASDEITIATVWSYADHPPLRDFLKGVVKHTENQLREVKGFNGRLRSYDLDPALATTIEQFIASITHTIVPPPPAPKVDIDLAEVARLQQESTAVFAMLHLPEEEPEPVAEPAPAPASPPLIDDAHDLPAEWLELAQQLSEVQVAVLTAVLHEPNPTATIAQIATDQFTMPSLLLDDINELADETIGDLLLETEPSPQISDEDYLPLVQQILAIRS